MKKKKIYKTFIVVEVLSEESYDETDLTQVAHDITEGDCSGQVFIKEKIELERIEAARAIEEQGSDPAFFGLDENGEELED